jgi:cyclomaltodextrinase / maltogenic alpha-amylase / neopullulanase
MEKLTIGATLLCGLALASCASSGGAEQNPTSKATKAQSASILEPSPVILKVQGPIQIDKPMGILEARLPCHRGASPMCDLRIYHVNVSSFVDGSPDHQALAGLGPGPHTGDIEGITGALEHIKAIGFNAILLTPIFDTKAGSPFIGSDGSSVINARLDGSGYLARDYFKIDPQFGTLESVERLIDEARSLGIKVMFDGVFGRHKGSHMASPSGALPSDDLTPEVDGGGAAGRKVDFSDPRSTAFYKEVVRFWTDTVGIDGWRLDRLDLMPRQATDEILSDIRSAANRQLLSGYVIADTGGSIDQIRTVFSAKPNSTPMSAFDIPTRSALIQVLDIDEQGIQDQPATALAGTSAMGSHDSYPDQAMLNMMIGSHQLVRFGDLIERAGKGGPASEAYWARHRLAFTFMAAWSGPITLYYGEELGAQVEGFSAKIDADCAALGRCDDYVSRNMVSIPGVNVRASAITPQAKALKDYLTSLMTLRASSPALASGSRTHIYSDKDLYVDLKSGGGAQFLLVMNVADSPRQVILSPSAVGQTSLEGAILVAGEASLSPAPTGLRLDIPALGAAILKVPSR